MWKETEVKDELYANEMSTKNYDHLRRWNNKILREVEVVRKMKIRS